MNSNRLVWRSLVPFGSGMMFAVATMFLLSDDFALQSKTYGQNTGQQKTEPVEILAQDIAILQDKISDQSHAMTDVDYHFSNLWFAGHEKNWPLADFYWKESLAHMRWAVRIIPVRKDNAGQEIKLNDILQSIENSPFMQVGKTIEAKDIQAFEKAYRTTMEGCYTCHKAADKPYLRLHVPERPASTMINFDPDPG